jgi:hypothetical protein
MKKVKVEVVLVRSYNLSAIIIHIGMFLWYLLRFKKPSYCYNHCELKYGEMTSGAISKGVKSRNFKEYLKYFTIELTEKQYEKGMKYLKSSENTKYEFVNFLFHTLKIFTDRWYGSKTTAELYCYEHVIQFLNATGKYNIDPFLNPVEAEKLFKYNLND